MMTRHTPENADRDRNGEDGNGDGDDRIWFCKEDWTTRAAVGRGIHQSRLIGPGGRHVASSWQEGLLRVGKDSAEQEKALRKQSHKGVPKL